MAAATWNFASGSEADMNEPPRSKSEIGHTSKPKTPSSAMWDSLGLSIRPSQIALLQSPPNERREYNMSWGKQMHIHRYSKQTDGSIVPKGYLVGGIAAGKAGRFAGAMMTSVKGTQASMSGWKETPLFASSLMQRRNSADAQLLGSSEPGGASRTESLQGGEPSVGRVESIAGHSESPVSSGHKTNSLKARLMKLGGESETPLLPHAGADRRNSDASRGDGEGVVDLSLAKKGSFLFRVKQLGIGNIQGKEFVRTLTRKNRPAIESVNPTIGNPYAKYTRQYRDDFCALIMGRRGEKGADSFGSCRAALEKEPHDRSMIDLENLLDFARRCTLLMSECTPVERFVALRSARIARLQAGSQVDTSTACIFIVISGSVVGHRFGTEVTFACGDPFGRKTIINAVRSLDEAKRPCTREAMGFAPGEGEGILSCRTDADLLYIHEWEFLRTWQMYTETVAAGQTSDTYVQSFLASLDVFRHWGWTDVHDLAHDMEGMQVDRGVTLFCEGDAVDGVHFLQFGECRMERARTGESASPAKYGLAAAVGAGDDGLPKLSIRRSHGPRTVTLGICGPRTVFGEEIAAEFKAAGAGPKAAVVEEAKRGYRVTCITDCWFVFFGRKVWRELAENKHDRHRHERAMRSIDVLREVALNRSRFVEARTEFEDKVEEFGKTKLPTLAKRGIVRWSL